MPQPTKGPRFGGSPAHQRIILANLASQLFEHGRITTTEAKAKRVQPLAERLIAKAKRGDLHNRRQVLSTITDKGVVHVLFTEIAPKLADRDGGYTRITRIGPRKGDNAPMAVIEVITESVEESRKAKAKGKSAASAPATKKADKPAKKDKKTEAVQAEVVADDAASDALPEVELGASDVVEETAAGSFRGETPPAGFEIKGNEDSMKYHTPESPWYGRTIAEVWFDSEESAQQAGFATAVTDADEA